MNRFLRIYVTSLFLAILGYLFVPSETISAIMFDSAKYGFGVVFVGTIVVLLVKQLKLTDNGIYLIKSILGFSIFAVTFFSWITIVAIWLLSHFTSIGSPSPILYGIGSISVLISVIVLIVYSMERKYVYFTLLFFIWLFFVLVKKGVLPPFLFSDDICILIEQFLPIAGCLVILFGISYLFFLFGKPIYSTVFSIAPRIWCMAFLFGPARFFFIILGSCSWLFYGLFKSDLVSIVSDDRYFLNSCATVCIWIGLVSALYAVVEWGAKSLLYGLDYFMYGERGCFNKKRQSPWFEDEANYLNKGDWRGFGFFLYNNLIRRTWVDRVLALDWYKKYFSQSSRFFGERSLQKFKNGNPGKMSRFFYKFWIAIRYNSALFRILDIVVICTVILSQVELLQGISPSHEFLQPLLEKSFPVREALKCPFNNLSFLLLLRLCVEKESRSIIKKSFLYGKLNKIIISLGTFVAIALVIASYTQKAMMPGLVFVDAVFTIVFLVELGMKIYEDGLGYFLRFDRAEKDSRWLERVDIWNVIDAVVVLASITSIFMLKDDFQGLAGMYAMIVLRLIRVLKLLRVLKLFQRDWAHLLEGIKYATVKSIPIIIIFAVILAFLGFLLYLVSANFGIGKKYFNDPINAIFSLFQLFTYDGWHTIPATISLECQELWPTIWWIDVAVRFGFCALVFAGGIIGVALLNSVFVDGMLGRDKSDEERAMKLQELNEKLDELNSKLAAIEKRDIVSR